VRDLSIAALCLVVLLPLALVACGDDPSGRGGADSTFLDTGNGDGLGGLDSGFLSDGFGRPDAGPDADEGDAFEDADQVVVEDLGGGDDTLEGDLGEGDLIVVVEVGSDPTTDADTLLGDTSPDLGSDPVADAASDLLGDADSLVRTASIVVAPNPLRFGEVGTLASEIIDLVVTNIGGEERLLLGVELQELPSQGFRVFGPGFPVKLGPDDSVAIPIRFRPTVVRSGSVSYANTIVVVSDDPIEPLISIRVTGTGLPGEPDACLTFDESIVDFGVPDGRVSQTVEISNCGDEDLDLESLVLVDAPEGLTKLHVLLPVSLGEISVILEYEPGDDDPSFDATLVAESDTGQVAILGISAGPPCPVANLFAETELSGESDNYLYNFAGEDFELTGRESVDPAGGDLSFLWNLALPTGADPGLDPDLFSSNLTLTPDVPGRYIVGLNVVSALTGERSCQPAIFVADAFPTDPRVVVQLSWETGDDLDLHILRSNDAGDFESFGSGRNFVFDDVYWANRFPDWGVANDPADNALYLLDITEGPGQETSMLGDLESDLDYLIGVNWARPRGDRSPEATITITIDGEETTGFTADVRADGYWTPAIITGAGEVEEVE
jgi:hypothetical protein